MARYIDADECLDTMLDEMAGTGYQDRAMRVIKYAPTADVEKMKYGEWIGVYGGRVSCSVCDPNREDDQPEYFKFMNYCPNCGAKMNHFYNVKDASGCNNSKIKQML